MLIDLIAAKPADAQAILSTPGHANIWPTLEAGSVDAVQLANLAFILQGKSLQADAVKAYAQSFERLVAESDEGPWIDQVPPDLLEGLASLSEEQLGSIARAWSSTDDARLARWNEAEAASFLPELSALAASALAQEQALLLWRCP